MKCRHCHTELVHSFIDLGHAPPSNAYLSAADLNRVERYYPLRVMVCDTCWLVQTEDFTDARELFDSNYAYFSSTSLSWLKHAENYCEKITRDLQLNKNSKVVEVASNDGYLLKNFVTQGIPCVGVEPTHSTAHAARQLGIPVVEEFFGETLAQKLKTEGHSADLILGNNVYAHVPDINDFTRGLKCLLKSNGTITLEFPHVLNLIEQKQFDTIYHEHFSYLSLLAVQKIFQSCGLRVWHVEQLPTHGGSLRVYGCHDEDIRAKTQALEDLEAKEIATGLNQLSTYSALQAHAFEIKINTLNFLLESKKKGKKIVAYGAAAKGNTLINYCGIKADLIEYVCDAAVSKQNKFMPGSHIPIHDPRRIVDTKPDIILVLPWNLKSEVKQQLSYVCDWGAQLVVLIPAIEVLPE